jgi:Peptidase family M28
VSKRTLMSLAGIALLLVLGFLAVFTVMPPGVRGSDAPEGEFSAARAFVHVRQVGKTTHVTGSPANDAVRDYLVTTLRGLGLDPQIQEADTVATKEGKAFGAHVRNIVTLIKGTAPTGRVILMAHYDSVQNGPGASDDGAGVSSILETTRALLKGPEPRNDVVLLLTDAEEACLCGAQAFVDQHPLGQGGGVVLNVEARGASGPAIMFETSAGNADVVGVYGKHAPHPVGTSFAVEVYRILPNDTDFSPFRDSKRFSGLNSAYIDGHDAYHQAQDTPERMDQRSLQHHGDNLLALTRAFAAEDLAQVAKPGSSDATYFPALGLLVRYPGFLVWPLAALALIAVLALGWISVRRGQTTVRRILVAFGFSLVPVIVTAVAAQLWWALLTLLQPGFANMIDPWQPVWLRWALIALVATAVLGWWLAVRRRLDAASLALGALGWLAVIAVVMAAVVPGGSYLLAIPALLGAAAGLIGNDIARLVAAAVAIIVLAPTVTLFFPALGLATGAAPALFAVFLGLALAPLAERLPAAKWCAIGAAVLLVTLTVTGLVVSRPGPAQPIPSHLVYALDKDTGTAQWVSGESSLSAYTSKYASKPGAVKGFPQLNAHWTGPAQTAELLASQVLAAGSMVTLMPQRQLAFVYIRAEGAAVITSANGRPVGATELTFTNPPATGLILVIASQGPYTLRVVDASYGLDGLPGYGGRPSGVTAAGSHSSDLVLVAKNHPGV